MKSFEYLEFIKGVTMIKEGESTSSAYFIMEGEIKLVKRSAAKPAGGSPKPGLPVAKLPRLSDL